MGDTSARRAASRLTRGPKVLLAIALILTVLVAVLQWRLLSPMGLVRNLSTDTAASELLRIERATAIDLAFLDGQDVAAQAFQVWWGGFWYLPEDTNVDLRVRVEGRVQVLVDGRIVLESAAVDGVNEAGRTVELSKGAHALIVRYAHHRGPMSLDVRHAPSGSLPRPFSSSELSSRQGDLGRYFLIVGVSRLLRVLTAVWLMGAVGLIAVRAGRRLAALPFVRNPRRLLSMLQMRERLASIRASFQTNDRRTVTHVLRDTAWSWLRLAGLSALVVAQPLLDAIARSPEFLVAHEASRGDVLVMVSGVVLLVPALITIPVILAGVAGRRPQALVESALAGVLMATFAMQIAVHADVEQARVAIPLAMAAGTAAAYAYHRAAVIRSIATAASFAVLVVPGAFFATPAIRRLMAPPPGMETPRPRFADAAVENGTAAPVVLLILDETPLVSLLDADGKIDPSLYPAFAELARDGILFRNATTVSDYTRWAVPAVLSGRYPRTDATPTAADHAESLFSLLGGTYRFEVIEQITALCPPDLCPPATMPFWVRQSLLASDLGYVYLHAISTADIARHLPSLGGNWRDFGELGAQRARRRSVQGDPARRINGPVAEAFLDGIQRDDGRPVFYALHTLLLHYPHLQLPTGQFNSTRAAVPAFVGSDPWNQDGWAVAQLYQRHLLQLRYVDTFLGRLLIRLRATGLYRRALIVVTSDHGISFATGTDRRRFSDQTAAAIMRVPLIVKTPEGAPPAAGPMIDVAGQHISDRNAQTIDIVPTIADVLRIPLPWEVDGVSLFDTSRPEPDSKTMFYDSARRSRTFGRMGPDSSAALQRKFRTFADPDVDDFAPRSDRFSELVGRSIDELHVEDGGGAVEVDYLSRFQQFDGNGADVAFDLAGRLVPATRARRWPTYIAVAVNGVVRSVTRTWQSEPLGWQTTPPRSVWREGQNDIQVYVVEDDGDGPLMRRCDLSPAPG